MTTVGGEVVAEIKSGTLDISRAEIEAGAWGDAVADYEQGPLDFTLSLEGFYDPANSGQSAMWDNLIQSGATNAAVTWVVTTATGSTFSSSGRVFGFSPRGEWGGLHMFSAKIRPNATALTRVVPEVAAG